MKFRKPSVGRGFTHIRGSGLREEAAEIAMRSFQEWYEGLRNVPQNQGKAKGTVAGALVVLDRMKESYSLDIDDYTASGGAQIAGASGSAVSQVLIGYGITKPYLREGGRTNRGLRGDIKAMLESLKPANLEELKPEDRNYILEQLKLFLVEKVNEYFGRQRIEFVFDSQKSIWETIHVLLDIAVQDGRAGAVAQYLVGAKLQLRFPDLAIGNESFSTADEQLSRGGDFEVGNTVFHVTVAPQPAVYDKCRQNLRDGARPYLLVPSGILEGTRQNAEQASQGQITVAAIESFVAQNIEELSYFSNDKLVSGIYALLTLYNQRVDETETDKSLMIKIPPNVHA